MGDHHVILAELRETYCREGLEEAAASPDPFVQFRQWLNDAVAADIIEPNAMSLATAAPSGQPSVRTVLLKGFDERGFCFFTNYASRKATELAANPKAAIVLHWRELERQVIAQGAVERTSEQESAAYFHTRPHGSQIGAWVSEHQSSAIPDREFLAHREHELLEKWPKGDEVPLPPFWGGYRLRPEFIEFWQGRPNRLHDRLAYTREGDTWTMSRLSP